MKNYKDYEKVFIGDSDIAALILSGDKGDVELKFGQDGRYNAYLVERTESEEVQIGEHYHKVFETDKWLKIFDDGGLTKVLFGKITIYRAGEGCIIEVVNKDCYRVRIHFPDGEYEWLGSYDTLQEAKDEIENYLEHDKKEGEDFGYSIVKNHEQVESYNL